MRLRLNFNFAKINIFLFFVLVSAFVSVVIGYRDYSIGTDTLNYINIYDIIGYDLTSASYEIGFVSVAKIMHELGASVEIFFSFIAFFVTVFMYFAFLRFSDFKSSSQLVYFSLFFFMMLFLSSWYFTGVTNALRHAMALSVLYLSLSFFKDKKWVLFLSCFLLSVLFHKTIIMLTPFLILCLSRHFTLRASFYLFLFFALGYPLGINEQLVKLLSGLLGLGVYEMIVSYGVDDWGVGLWQGFDARFFIYNIFWYLLPLLLVRIRVVEKTESLVFLIKIYSVLCVYYFIFGFGAFSNRWAYPSWLILPIIQGYLLSHAKVNIYVKFFSSFLCFVSLFYFLGRFYVY